jgi:hypothetical protein
LLQTVFNSIKRQQVAANELAQLLASNESIQCQSTLLGKILAGAEQARIAATAIATVKSEKELHRDFAKIRTEKELIHNTLDSIQQSRTANRDKPHAEAAENNDNVELSINADDVTSRHSTSRDYSPSTTNSNPCIYVTHAQPVATFATSNDNLNLTDAQKELVKWHNRLGHIGFDRVKQVLATGRLAKTEGTARRHRSASKAPTPLVLLAFMPNSDAIRNLVQLA